MLSAYRAAGAELPFSDPSRYRGAGIEGYFWRCTDVARGRVVSVLAAVSRLPHGPPWGLVALAAHPRGLVRSAAAPAAVGHGQTLRIGELLHADHEGLRVELGSDARLALAVQRPAAWPPRAALGAMGPIQLLPGLSQYWHPHLLRAEARGWVQVGDERWSLDGASVYAEKNWGPSGMPRRWWWGQAHGFEREDVTVAFAGGPASWGPIRLTGTVLVIAVGDTVLRFVRPLVPMAVAVDAGGWRLRVRTVRYQLEVEAHADGLAPTLLPVPVPGQRRYVDARSPQHLAGTLRLDVRRRGQTLFAGTSRLAGLEHGEGDVG